MNPLPTFGRGASNLCRPHPTAVKGLRTGIIFHPTFYPVIDNTASYFSMDEGENLHTLSVSSIVHIPQPSYIYGGGAFDAGGGPVPSQLISPFPSLAQARSPTAPVAGEGGQGVGVYDSMPTTPPCY
jgi:hypothetical protein